MTGKKWWIAALAVLLAALVCLFAFWDAVAIYIMPKTVLTNALTDLFSQLQQRYEQSPISVIAASVDPDSRYTAQMHLQTQNDLAGQVTYDMQVQTDGAENRLLAEGVASTSGNDLDLSIYMDSGFMAVSSEELLKGAYYGITYETFPEDIRSIPLLKMLISENILTGWDASIANIQTQMEKDYTIPDFSQVSQEDMHLLLTAILLLPSDVEQVEMQVGGEYTKCHRITYSAAGEQVKEVLGHLMDTGSDSEASVSASFYLYENQIVLMHMQCNAGENSVRFALEKMSDDANSLVLRAAKSENGEEFGLYLKHSVRQEGSYTYETWLSYPTFEATGEKTQVSYRWEPVMGELLISDDQPVPLFIKQIDGGFHIQTEEFDRLMDLLYEKETPAERTPIACAMSVRKGSDITVPSYKNLSNWSLEDLITLLGGVGSLFGLQIG